MNTIGWLGRLCLLVLALLLTLCAARAVGAPSFSLATSATNYTYDWSHPAHANSAAGCQGQLDATGPLSTHFGLGRGTISEVGACVAAEEGATAADQSAFDYATTSSKLDHIFAAKHNFDPLVQQFGSREAVVQQLLNGLKGLTPESGTFEQQIVVGGQKVVVRGAVVNGVTEIGTAFTP